jgi:aryl-alcohol dehydrogenase-like predicted oxidoreductase
MQYRRLGNSGLIVSDLCLGTMIFGEEGPRSTSADTAVQMIHRFLDAGGTFIDTADVYAGGRSEEIVGRAIADRRDDVVLATKVRFPTGEGRNDQGLSRHHILRGVHASLRRLNTDVIDVLYVHCWDPFTPLAETLRALDDLVRQGDVRYLGVSNFKAWQVMKALGLSDANGSARFVAGQYQYSLVQRDVEYEFEGLFQSEGVGLVPWGPLGGGFLSGKYRRGERPAEGRIATATEEQSEAWDRRSTERNWRIVDAVGKVADARGASYAQVALAWLRTRPTVSSVILGARTPEQLDDNLGAADLDLTPDEVDALDAASRPPDLYPYRMIEAYGTRSL